MLNLKTGTSVQFTSGKQNDGKPHWSPHGQTLAFVSSRDKKTGIYLMPVSGGAERKLIEIEASIGELNWTPDGKKLVFCMRYKDSHFIKDEKKKTEPPVYRHITRLFYRLDGLGFLPKDTFQIYSLDIATAKLTKLTAGKRTTPTPTSLPTVNWLPMSPTAPKTPILTIFAMTCCRAN